MILRIVITQDMMAEAVALLLHVTYGMALPTVQVFESDQGYFADVTLMEQDNG